MMSFLYNIDNVCIYLTLILIYTFCLGIGECVVFDNYDPDLSFLSIPWTGFVLNIFMWCIIIIIFHMGETTEGYLKSLFITSCILLINGSFSFIDIYMYNEAISNEIIPNDDRSNNAKAISKFIADANQKI